MATQKSAWYSCTRHHAVCMRYSYLMMTLACIPPGSSERCSRVCGSLESTFLLHSKSWPRKSTTMSSTSGGHGRIFLISSSTWKETKKTPKLFDSSITMLRFGFGTHSDHDWLMDGFNGMSTHLGHVMLKQTMLKSMEWIRQKYNTICRFET